VRKKAAVAGGFRGRRRAAQAVADIDDEGAGQSRGLDPPAGPRAHFEAAAVVGREQRQVAVVGVRPSADWFIPGGDEAAG
jgi:hypothetical protein